MKKIISFLLLAFSVNGFADKLIYCPERIECSGNTVESCRAIGGNQEVFKNMNGMHIEKAAYVFSYAQGVYEPTSDFQYSWMYQTCFYAYKVHPRLTKTIQISLDKDTKLALHFEDSEKNKWVIPNACISKCESLNPQDCPFKPEVKK